MEPGASVAAIAMADGVNAQFFFFGKALDAVHAHYLTLAALNALDRLRFGLGHD